MALGSTHEGCQHHRVIDQRLERQVGRTAGRHQSAVEDDDRRGRQEGLVLGEAFQVVEVCAVAAEHIEENRSHAPALQRPDELHLLDQRIERREAAADVEHSIPAVLDLIAHAILDPLPLVLQPDAVLGFKCVGVE